MVAGPEEPAKAEAVKADEEKDSHQTIPLALGWPCLPRTSH